MLHVFSSPHAVSRLVGLLLAVLVAAPLHAQNALPLTPGQTMQRGARYQSASGTHYLIFQADGNLVVYTSADGFVWGLNETDADFARAARVDMQPDGNLAVYDASGAYVWSALTADPAPGSILLLTPDGALQLVSDERGVMWASDGNLTSAAESSPRERRRDARPREARPRVSRAEDRSADAAGASASGDCAPLPGWPQCVSVGSPDIQVYGTGTVSASAMRVVADIYRDMTGRLRPAYPASRFDGFRVFITNSETQQQLAALPEIAEFAPDPSGPNSKIQLQGGTGGQHLWISEQMICKTGVASRGASDTTPRAFDQVVHEFSHAIDNTYSLRPRILGMYTAAENRDFPSVERFPWSVQHYLSTPTGTLSAGEQQLMNDLFTGPTSYSCDSYRP